MKQGLMKSKVEYHQCKQFCEIIEVVGLSIRKVTRSQVNNCMFLENQCILNLEDYQLFLYPKSRFEYCEKILKRF